MIVHQLEAAAAHIFPVHRSVLPLAILRQPAPIPPPPHHRSKPLQQNNGSMV
jgi:hypothetical protein